MFQVFDDPVIVTARTRPEWMALLARAPLILLESALASYSAKPTQWLRQPETGLMMVQGRAGATGDRFNLGEVTVTRCALRLTSETSDHFSKPISYVGVAYVLGRSMLHARLAATADALLQDPAHCDDITVRLLEPIQQHLKELNAHKHQKTAGTRVEFFTVARESSDSNSTGDGQ
jgi:alpha-D-ribose 1-methylphosphonate 5-triphosphate synthase subunit PhnG